MRVTILAKGDDGSAATSRPVEVDGTGSPVGVDPGYPASYGDWLPSVVLGAPAPGALLLPPAAPTASWMYGPRGVHLEDDLVVVADTGNHRVLIWHGLPGKDGAPADVVLGQPDEHTEGPAAGGRGVAGGMHLPCGVTCHDGRLVVADAWHHRLLVWDEVPAATDTPPDRVLGQPDAESAEPNAGGEPSASSMYWPFGIAVIDGRCYVADTGNRRVLVWRDGLPEPGQPADVVLGQPDATSREENRGGEPGPASFRWPHAIAAGGPHGSGGVWIADAGNHRVLGWGSHPERDEGADVVLGQPDMSSAGEFPYVPQVDRYRFPYGLATLDGAVAVADTANNRVLLQDGPVQQWRPQVALAQPDLAANGENRWHEVARDTLCWPYGLAWHRGQRELLAVADSGNNRVVLWERRGQP